MIIGGIMTLAGPALGVLGTVIGMIGGFNTLGESGIAHTDKLSSDISSVMISTVVGISIGVTGLGVLVFGLIFWRCTRVAPTAPPINT